MPENVTLLAKTAAGSAASSNERTITVKKGDTVASILRELGALARRKSRRSPPCSVPRGRDGGLKEGTKLRILMSPTGGRMQPMRLILVGETAVEAVVALSDLGKYVPVDVKSAETLVAERDEEEEDDGTACGSIRASTRRRCATRFRGP